jgi:hypothetical protein
VPHLVTLAALTILGLMVSCALIVGDDAPTPIPGPPQADAPATRPPAGVPPFQPAFR